MFAPIQSTYEKEATGMENPKMQSLFWCRKPTSQYGPANYPASKLPGFMQRRIGPSVQIFRKSGLPFAEVSCLHQSNLHMKRKLREWRTQKCNPCFGAESTSQYAQKPTSQYGNGEPKNAILVLVQKAHLAVRASKPPGFMQRRIGP